MKLIVAFLILTCNCLAANLFVAPNGSDENPGTPDRPFARLNTALQAARTISDSVTIYLRGGVTYLTEPVTLSSLDSRADDQPLVIRNFEDEKVTLSGAMRINPEWRAYKGGIVQANLELPSEMDRLFVNGQLMHMARYPNFDPKVRHFNGYAADAISKKRLKKWAHPEGAFLHVMHRHLWGDLHYRITGVSSDGNAILKGGHQNNRPLGMHEEYRFVENVFEELDAPGEWFWDKDSQTLYFYPPDSIDVQNAVFEVTALKSLIRFEGSQNKPIKTITLQGIELVQTRRTFMEKYEPLLRSDWTIFRGGALFIEGTENCRIDNCTLKSLGGNAIFVSNYNRGLFISGNELSDIGASGVAIVGDPGAVRSPSFQYHDFIPLAQMDRQPGPKTDNYPADCLIEDNLIHNIGTVEKQTAGVQISMAMNITVSHNSIYHVPRAGINIGDGTWGGHVIEFNDVFDTVRETGDHGSFNSWGRDRYWHPNRKKMDRLAKEHPELVKLDAIKTTVIRQNRFRCDHGWDIDLDDGSSNYHIVNNLCLNGGIKLREGFDRLVENNIMINNSFHPHVWFENSHDVFRRNIVADWYKPIRLQGWGKEIDYNIFPDSIMLKKSHSKGLDEHGVVGGTAFLDPAHGDYRLQKSDPAFSVGFKNVAMDSFGVVSPRLKKKAQTLDFPMPIETANNQATAGPINWRGAEIKNITTPADQSALGLGDTNGVWIVSLAPKSSLARDGIQAGDVILRYDDAEIKDVKTLLLADKAKKWMGRVDVIMYRNQHKIKIGLSADSL